MMLKRGDAVINITSDNEVQAVRFHGWADAGGGQFFPVIRAANGDELMSMGVVLPHDDTMLALLKSKGPDAFYYAAKISRTCCEVARRSSFLNRTVK